MISIIAIVLAVLFVLFCRIVYKKLQETLVIREELLQKIISAREEVNTGGEVFESSKLQLHETQKLVEEGIKISKATMWCTLAMGVVNTFALSAVSDDNYILIFISTGIFTIGQNAVYVLTEVSQKALKQLGESVEHIVNVKRTYDEAKNIGE